MFSSEEYKKSQISQFHSNDPTIFFEGQIFLRQCQQNQLPRINLIIFPSYQPPMMPLSQLNYQYTCFFDVQLSSSPNSITAFKLLLPSLSQPSQSSAHYQEGKEERQKTKKRKNEKTKNLRKSRPKVKMRSNTKKRSNLKMRSNTKKSSTSPHKGTNSTASWPTLLARRDNRNHIKFNTRSPDPPEKPRRLRQHLPLPVEDEWRPRRLHLLRLQEDGCPAVRLHDAVEQLHRRELVQPPQLGDRGVRRQPKLG